MPEHLLHHLRLRPGRQARVAAPWRRSCSRTGGTPCSAISRWKMCVSRPGDIGSPLRLVTADLSTTAGIDTIAEIAAAEPVDVLINNTGVAHYMPLADLPADKATELVHVKILAPTLLTRAVIGGMRMRGTGTINVVGMIAFSGPAPSSVMPRRAVCTGALAALLAFSQTLSAELEGTGIRVQVLLPGVVAT
ncbi:SDR family NAD(P)-dependent oxidoreductase [Thermomonospora cellulosilytica]|uniref:Short-subunit dehydrogenase n=1 Tax=Thermomonospora cellulosilytica TaxID=1411118 RepID=A0A7W3R796_9ACTN|nr:SDR family NAD(P)-dependent oxidoreductase [Thermomonospora cellulosilytica]MBA9003013.1 short-subunit dehydrogenase [Thermomonospora cellulosilytica]